MCFHFMLWNLCKTALFVRFLRQAQISILEIFHIFLCLKFSPSLNSNKNYHFSKFSLYHIWSPVAQLAEQVAVNHWVRGSSPCWGAISTRKGYSSINRWYPFLAQGLRPMEKAPKWPWACRRAVNHSYLFTNVSMNAWFYILRLRSGTLYPGATKNLEERYKAHIAGNACRTTKLDLPVEVVYSESFPTFSDARKREAQIKRWSRAKKEALVAGDMVKLRNLSKSRNRKEF